MLTKVPLKPEKWTCGRNRCRILRMPWRWDSECLRLVRRECLAKPNECEANRIDRVWVVRMRRAIWRLKIGSLALYSSPLRVGFADELRK